MKQASVLVASCLLVSLSAPVAAHADGPATATVPRTTPQVMRLIPPEPEPDTVYGMGECRRVEPGQTGLFSVSVRCVQGGRFSSENQSWDMNSFIFTGAGAHASNRACTQQASISDNEFTDASCELLWEARRQAFQDFILRASEDGAAVSFFGVRRQERVSVFEVQAYSRAN